MNTLTWKYVKPLQNKQAVTIFLNQFGLLFSDDFFNCIQKFNGGRPNKKIFDTRDSKGRMFKCLLSFNKNDLESIYDAFNIMQKENSNLIPFANDPAGNYICFEKSTMNVVFWEHETGRIEYVAKNFEEFLSSLY